MNMPKILVIDDDDDFLTLVEMRLKTFGYETLTSDDPEKGIALAQSEQPDLILLDLYMPGMDGYEVSKFLLADGRTKHIPIIILSSAEAMRFSKKSLDWGADAFVQKNAVELSKYLQQGEYGQDIPMARKDELEFSLLNRVIKKVLDGKDAAV